jgi:hypothetical protein
MADPTPPGPRPTRRELAAQYLIEHPESRDSEVARNTGVDPVTVGRARKGLIDEGVLAPQTKRRATAPRAKRGPAADPNTLLTDADLRDLETGAIDDEDTRKRILGSLRKIAFAPGMNYETAMNAMSLWIKLKDQASTKELGPGSPVTYADAKARLLRLMKAVGFELVFECFQELFVPKEAPDVQHSEAVVAADPPPASA